MQTMFQMNATMEPKKAAAFACAPAAASALALRTPSIQLGVLLIALNVVLYGILIIAARMRRSKRAERG